jgi:hypothetical protein
VPPAAGPPACRLPAALRSPVPASTAPMDAGRLYEFLIPIMCADPNYAAGSVSCANVPILSIPNFNVYQRE